MTEVFLLNIGGSVLCYYNSIQEKNEAGMGENNPHMVASFLTGILQFAEKIQKDEINHFDMGSKYIVITSTIFSDTSRIYYVILAEKSTKKNIKYLEEKLDKIRNEFEETYSRDDIVNWNGDLDFFEQFNSAIKIVIDGDSRILTNEERKKKFLQVWKEKVITFNKIF